MERPDAETNNKTPTLQDWLIVLAGLAVIGGVLALFVIWLLSFDWWWLFVVGFGFMVLIDICRILVIFDYLRKADCAQRRNIAYSFRSSRICRDHRGSSLPIRFSVRPENKQKSIGTITAKVVLWYLNKTGELFRSNRQSSGP